MAIVLFALYAASVVVIMLAVMALHVYNSDAYFYAESKTKSVIDRIKFWWFTTKKKWRG